MLSDEERNRLERLRAQLAEQDPSYVAVFETREQMLESRKRSTSEVADRVLFAIALWWLALVVSLFVQQAYGPLTAAVVCLSAWALISMTFGTTWPWRSGRRAPT